MKFNDSNLATSKKILNVEVALVESVETHPDAELSHLSVLKVLGHTLIAGKLEDGSHRYLKGDLVVYFPVGFTFPLDLLKKQGFYWDAEKDRGLLKGNKRNRVGPVTRGSVTSDGILFPVDKDAYFEGVFKVEGVDNKWTDVKEGDILNEFYGVAP